jgi:diaminopimelate decarboxylase
MTSAQESQALHARDPALLAGLETPCYFFDPASVAEDLRELRQLLGTPVVVSVKASPVLDLLVRCNPAFGDGIEIASLGELNLTIGRMSVPRFVNTPALDATLIAAALACRATLVADSPQHIALIESALRKPAMQNRAPEGIVLRVNAASLLGRSGPSADHFGMDPATLHRELARLSESAGGLKVIGLHVFAGSHSFAGSSPDIAQHLAGLVGKLRRYDAAKLEVALIGAGLGADWREAGLDFAAYRNSLRDLQGQVRVMHEAGRSVFSRSGTFATRIVAVKELNDESVVVCDGGLAHCFALAQTEQFVKRWREPRLMKAGDAPPAHGAPARTHKVVGNSCNRADVIGRLQSAQAPEPGDMLLFEHCGAYHSYSPTGFLNLRPARRYIAS